MINCRIEQASTLRYKDVIIQDSFRAVSCCARGRRRDGSLAQSSIPTRIGAASMRGRGQASACGFFHAVPSLQSNWNVCRGNLVRWRPGSCKRLNRMLRPKDCLGGSSREYAEATWVQDRRKCQAVIIDRGLLLEHLARLAAHVIETSFAMIQVTGERRELGSRRDAVGLACQQAGVL